MNQPKTKKLLASTKPKLLPRHSLVIGDRKPENGVYQFNLKRGK